ncbi:hypothetical protein [Flavobacterium sp.]|uniref:hypothetical protein n=1 Tax=Flavobacterium sp. TaxID=239 RepID=UPI0037510D4C
MQRRIGKSCVPKKGQEKINNLCTMKKSIFTGVAVLTVFTLFSFSTVKKNATENEAKIVETKAVRVPVFTRDERTFSDKFTYRREVTTGIAANQQSSVLDKY